LAATPPKGWAKYLGQMVLSKQISPNAYATLVSARDEGGAGRQCPPDLSWSAHLRIGAGASMLGTDTNPLRVGVVRARQWPGIARPARASVARNIVFASHARRPKTARTAADRGRQRANRVRPPTTGRTDERRALLDAVDLAVYGANADTRLRGASGEAGNRKPRISHVTSLAISRTDVT